MNLLPGIIYCDPREGSKGRAGAEWWVKLFSDTFGIRASSQRVLPACDFAFTCGHRDPSPFCEGDYGCRIGIERKTYSDLCGSLLRKRLDNHQVPAILEHFTMAWLGVEGIWRPTGPHLNDIEVLEHRGWKQSRSALSYQQVMGWMTRYEVEGRGRIHVTYTDTKHETAAMVASRFRWWSKEWKKHRMQSVEKWEAPDTVLMWKATPQEKFVSGTPDLGIKRMKQVMLHFASPDELVNASLPELKRAGLGDAIARKVYTFYRRRWRA